MLRFVEGAQPSPGQPSPKTATQTHAQRKGNTPANSSPSLRGWPLLQLASASIAFTSANKTQTYPPSSIGNDHHAAMNIRVHALSAPAGARLDDETEARPLGAARVLATAALLSYGRDLCEWAGKGRGPICLQARAAIIAPELAQATNCVWSVWRLGLGWGEGAAATTTRKRAPLSGQLGNLSG